MVDLTAMTADADEWVFEIASPSQRRSAMTTFLPSTGAAADLTGEATDVAEGIQNFFRLRGRAGR